MRDARKQEPDEFTEFFEQTKLEAFFFKKSEMNGMSYCISKPIVETIVRDLLFDEDEAVAGDIAMKAFQRVRKVK